MLAVRCQVFSDFVVFIGLLGVCRGFSSVRKSRYYDRNLKNNDSGFDAFAGMTGKEYRILNKEF